MSYTMGIDLLESYVLEAGYYAMRDRLDQEDSDTVRSLIDFSKEDVVGAVCRDLLELRGEKV